MARNCPGEGYPVWLLCFINIHGMALSGFAWVT
ncbi:hypothetical protein PANA5342_3334 [Pantoea ananatis LMG 5342]|nr:hypothetical protein PANA5342_3334 [Pantoea ananatis LMG 5342]